MGGLCTGSHYVQWHGTGLHATGATQNGVDVKAISNPAIGLELEA